jgi:hypothetical protein
MARTDRFGAISALPQKASRRDDGRLFNPHARSTMKTHAILRRTLIVASLAVAATALAAPARPIATAAPNAVVHWNGVAADAFAPSQGTNPMMQSRTFAILHASIHDALNSIERRYAPHTPGLPAAPRASADAAVAAASRDVLVQLVPEQAARIETAYAQAIAAMRDDAARSAGITVGRAAAAATLARRRGDGSEAAALRYQPRSGAGEYQFTAPFDFAGLPGWGNVKPFAIELRDHALPGPQALASADYARDLAHVKAIGHVASTTRTAEQSEIAKFWYEDSPLGWNRIAHTVIRERGLDAWDSARAFALVHFAMADGFIAGFDAKYRFRFWRPVTAIHAAANDGNPRTEADPNWQPFLVTPPVPDYPSTHTVLGWAAAQVLIELFGDKVRYEMTSLTLPGVTRAYRGFAQAAEENGQSRIYAGIHFVHAVNAGRSQGRSIGRSVAKALAPQH